MHKINNFILLVLVTGLLTNCGNTDDRLAESSSSARQEIYDFMNDVRLEMTELEPHYTYLTDFVKETKAFLESKEAQSHYKITGLYFEQNLDRKTGAHNYEDRFFNNGMVMHLIIYPPTQKEAWRNLLGIDKGAGKQVGRNFVYYQVFSAHPTNEGLENKIIEIIERNMEKHAAAIGAFNL